MHSRTPQKRLSQSKRFKSAITKLPRNTKCTIYNLPKHDWQALETIDASLTPQQELEKAYRALSHRRRALKYQSSRIEGALEKILPGARKEGRLVRGMGDEDMDVDVDEVGVGLKRMRSMLLGGREESEEV